MTPEQQTRLTVDPRLKKNCEACGCPGYMHENAERQYETGSWGVFRFEVGDINCENPDCEIACTWYEGDNWGSKQRQLPRAVGREHPRR